MASEKSRSKTSIFYFFVPAFVIYFFYFFATAVFRRVLFDGTRSLRTEQFFFFAIIRDFFFVTIPTVTNSI